ncbi:DUF2171 domain-containing protein [Sphingomonas sp. CJ20]
MNDRNRRYGRENGSDYQEYGRDFGSGRDYTYSSARDYAAAGELGRGRRDRAAYGAGAHRDDDQWSSRDYTQARDTGARGQWRDGDRERSGYGRETYANRAQRPDDDRGFFERAGDEVRSWFGDEEAERRRERDARYDAQYGGDRDGDGHYSSWRRQRIAELDRDYDEYRRENAQRFHNEFTGWRTERQTQRDSLGRIAEHMDVVGSDGTHVGTVDKVRGDRIVLTKSDSAAGGHHHSIPSRWIQSVDDKVTLRKTADEAKAHWKDEERGALFGEDRNETAGDRDAQWRGGNLSRSFSGTY